MPAHEINLNALKTEITSWFYNDLSSKEIVERLANNHNIVCTSRTIERRLKVWGLRKRARVKETLVLRLKIVTMFFMNFPDTVIVHALNQEGYPIGLTQLVRLRKAQGCQRRLTVWQREEANNQLWDIVKAELDKGEIEGYGKELLIKYFRTKGINTTRDSLFSIVKQLDPIGLARRTNNVNRKRGEYIVPGPNFIWSIDGHDKLAYWGFEIYGCIDAYSRNIIWMYVGISNRTTLSVLQQYLNVCSITGFQPKIIRSDRGKETLLCAEVHFAFARTMQQDPNFKFGNCWFYGTSTGNQRIESWWSQIEKSQLYQWREYFEYLSQTGQFDKNSLVDRITMLAIYMPLVRDAVHAYVELWNHHNIRKQPNRPNAVTGIPYILYHYPPQGVESYDIPVDQKWISEIEKSLQEWDIDEYLPLETKEWCTQQLKNYQIDISKLCSGDVISDGVRAHTQAYTCLRQIVRDHINSNKTPILSESPKPRGGYGNVEMQGGALLDLVRDNADFVRTHDGSEFLENIEQALVLERENPEVFEDLETTDIS